MGVAVGDQDNDGWVDILLTTSGGPAYLLRNLGGNPNNALRPKTVGTRSSKNGIGAMVRLRAAHGTSWQTVPSGSSHCSSSDLMLTFGLGKATQADSIEIAWPSAQRDPLRHLNANHTYSIEEGGKVLATKPFRR